MPSSSHTLLKKWLNLASSAAVLSTLVLTTVNAQCLTLSNSAACAEWNGYQIGMTPDAPFTNVSTFDTFMLSAFQPSSLETQRFQVANNCPNYSGQLTRYTLSINCAFFVAAASQNGCPNPTNPANPQSLCSSTASTFLNNYQSLLQNSTICGGSPNMTVFNSYQTYVKSLNTNSSTSCTPGSNKEMLQCGYSDTTSLKTYCSVNPSDTCCSSSSNGGNTTSPSSLLPSLTNATLYAPASLTTGTSSSPSSTSTSAASSNSSGPTISTGLIIGCAFAAFVALLIITFIIISCCRRKTAIDAEEGSNKNYDGGASGYSNMASVSDVAATGSANAALAGGAIIAGGGAVAMAGAAAATSSSTSATGVQISETMQVMYNYVPNLSDEIYLYVNDPVIVKTKFDDGWAFGYNMTTKQEGSFPLACVGPYDKENNNSKGGPRAGGSADFGSRGSSLYLNEKYASGLSRLRESTTANGVTTIAPPPGGGGGVSTAGSGVPSNQRTYPSLYNSMYQS